MRKGPTLEDCTFEYMDDDGVPIHGAYGIVTASAGREVTLGAHAKEFCRAGDRLRVYNEHGTLLGGNSDGDLAMIRLANGSKTHWTGIIHHTDAEREFSYNRESLFGRLDKGLSEAGPNTWRVVDMQREWKTVFPPVKE